MGLKTTDDSVTMQRQLAELLLNSQLLRGVQSAADVEAMATEKRALALRAMRNALSCVDICLRGRFVSCWRSHCQSDPQYTAGLVYSPHFTQVSIAFAATFLVRIARYFPDELDLPRVAEDVEAIAAILARSKSLVVTCVLRSARQCRGNGYGPEFVSHADKYSASRPLRPLTASHHAHGAPREHPPVENRSVTRRLGAHPACMDRRIRPHEPRRPRWTRAHRHQ